MKSEKCNKIAALLLAAFTAAAFAGCGVGKGPDPSGNESAKDGSGGSSADVPVGEYNRITFYDKLFGNRRDYTAEEFLNPAVEYRLLPVLNEDASKPKGASVPNLEKLKEYGYGGVVTNVGWTDDYLTNEDAWELAEEAVAYAIEDLGLRVWLYDEHGYPSGGARDVVLKDNPDWQAQGVAQKSVVVPAGGSRSIVCPAEHTLLAAYAYPGEKVTDADVSSALPCIVDKAGKATFVNDTGKDCILICLYRKYWYEGTHPQWNILESRRYIDVMRAEPVKKFLDVTYEAYKKRFGKYFNNGVESFFYDEPALPGMYKGSCAVLNVFDKPNENLELLDTCNYSPALKDYFQKRWGYDLTPYLPYLYKDGYTLNSSAEAMRFRMHYNACVAELFAENYFGQIGEWCAKNNINASGHLLGEESPAACAVYSGNVMRNYANVQIPGIDLLSGDPGVTARWGNVMKTCSSSAQFYGKSRVFCEVSDWGYQNEDWDARICSLAVQYACGVNTFVSYYEPFTYDEETNRKFADTTARIGYMLGGGIGEKDVAVYYPAEGLFAATTNFDSSALGSTNTLAGTLSGNFTELSFALLSNQIDYENFDAEMLREAKIENGRLVTPAGERFSTLVVPKTCAMYADVLDKIERAAACGVRVVLQDDGGWICESEEKQAAFEANMEKLLAHENVSVKENTAAVAKAVSDSAYVRADSDCVVACKQRNENNSVYLVCNTADAEKNVALELSDAGKTFKLWDPFAGTAETIEPDSERDGWSAFRLSLGKYKCVLITAE